MDEISQSMPKKTKPPKPAKNKAVWLFAGSPMQKIAARKIKELGFKLILTDQDTKCSCLKFADEFINLDTFDIQGNLKTAEKLKTKYQIKAVFTSAADCHETVAHVAKALNLPGINPEISHICRYKIKTRQKLNKAGIPQPVSTMAQSIKEAQLSSEEIGLPVLLKSSNNSGSRGLVKIDKLSDITPEVFLYTLRSGTTNYLVVEKLLQPVESGIAEQSVETLWYNGKMYWLNWVDRLFRKDFNLFESFKKVFQKAKFEWGVELAHINPAVHDFKLKQRVFEMIYKAGIAIGMDEQTGGHVLKADIMFTKDGPYILELTPRLSGGWDSSITTPLRGADFVGGVITLALGEKLTLDLWHQYFEYKNPALYASIFAKVSPRAKDSIDRQFAVGSSFDREISLKNAYEELIKGNYIT